MEIVTAWLQALQSTDPVTALRASRWVYPLVNAFHIIGIALLFGAIVPLDLRLLGIWRSLPVAVVARISVPVSAVGLGLTLTAGGLLFSVNAVKYAAMPLFMFKMGLLVLAVANAMYIARAGVFDALPVGGKVRFAAVLSLILWLSIILSGRMIAYV